MEQEQIEYLLSRLAISSGSLTISFGYGDFTFEGDIAEVLKKRLHSNIDFLCMAGDSARSSSCSSPVGTGEEH